MNMARIQSNEELFIETGFAMAEYFIRTAKYKESEKILIKLLTTKFVFIDRVLECKIIGNVGKIYKLTNNTKAKIMFDKQLEIAMQINHNDLYCEAMNNLSSYFISIGEYENGYQAAKKSLAITVKTGNDLLMREVVYIITQYAFHINDFSLAEKHLSEISSQRNLQYAKPQFAKYLAHSGYAKCKLGDFDAGIALMQKGLAIVRLIDDYRTENLICTFIAMAYHSKNEFKKAAFFFHKAAKINIKTGNIEPLFANYCNLVNCYNQLGNNQKALEFLRKQKKIAQISSNRLQIAISYRAIAAHAFFTGNYTLAIKNFLFEKKLLRNTDAEFTKALCLSNLGLVYLTTESYIEAKAYYEKAIKKLKAIKNTRFQAAAYLDLAKIAKATGKVKKLREYVRLAKEKAEIVGDMEIVRMAEEVLQSAEKDGRSAFE